MAIENLPHATDTRDIQESLYKKLRQLRALLLRAYGEDGEQLFSMAESLRDDYMWACFDLADDCSNMMMDVISNSVTKKNEVTHA